MTEHREAVEYDMLTLTGHGLADIGRGIKWGELQAILHMLPADSALVRDMDPELHAWSTKAKTNSIPADIFDMLAQINANLCAIGTGKPAKEPKLYPRPCTKQKEETTIFGSDGKPSDALLNFFKVKKNARSSECDS